MIVGDQDPLLQHSLSLRMSSRFFAPSGIFGSQAERDTIVPIQQIAFLVVGSLQCRGRWGDAKD